MTVDRWREREGGDRGEIEERYGRDRWMEYRWREKERQRTDRVGIDGCEQRGDRGEIGQRQVDGE